MNESDLRDLLPPERLLPAARRRDMKERLMEQINDEVRSSRQRYRVLAGALAAALLVIAGAVAVLASNDGDTTEIPSATTGGGDMTTTPPPSPSTTAAGGVGSEDEGRAVPNSVEVARTMAVYEQYPTEAPADGSSRVSLDAEQIMCVAPGTLRVTESGPGNARISHFPLGDALTRELIITQCTNGSDWNGTDYSGLDQGQATACVRAGARSSDGSEVVDEFPLAVVATNDLSCQDVAEDGVIVREMTEADLARLNRMRGLEVAFMAGPPTDIWDDDACATPEQEQEWAQDVLNEEANAWPAGLLDSLEVIIPDSISAPPNCPYSTLINWHTAPDFRVTIEVDSAWRATFGSN